MIGADVDNLAALFGVSPQPSYLRYYVFDWADYNPVTSSVQPAQPIEWPQTSLTCD